MAGFLSPLRLEYQDGRRWTITETFEYCLGGPDGPERVIVPQGFVTDFASIPRALWTLLPPTGTYGKAAVIHDYLYQRRAITMWKPRSAVLTVDEGREPHCRLQTVRLCGRGEADHIFLEAMQVLGVGWWVQWILYLGVRAGGWNAWARQHRRLRETSDGDRPWAS